MAGAVTKPIRHLAGVATFIANSVKWKVTIPSESTELEITPEFPQQELITNRSTRVTYWEGAAKIRGTMIWWS